MIEPKLISYLFMAVAGALSLIATYLAVIEKDLVKAVIYSAIQSTAYTILFYLLMAPDIALVYIPVAVGLYPAVVFFLIKKTERFEESG
ncbi:MAG: sodium:proton antiporter [Zestosphaera tikiterensis]|uniref:Sodium:proton antiporter n=1 Tax=Zestosphaera tikiterensis TaxID=1973259 RepID=A0A2R7Y8N7_9CREN|nr:MAG: sodium:proton antiporter [Zestosphaera tikiterensis]